MALRGLYSIRATGGFADMLARGLWRQAGEDPVALARMSVLLPTRRAVRTLRESFLRLGNGRPMLLPALGPVGDLDGEEGAFGGLDGLAAAGDLPPAIPGLRRQLLLTQLVRKFLESRQGSGEQAGEAGRGMIRGAGFDHAALLARELAGFLDQVHTEQLDTALLAGLVRDRYARHWQEVLEFLAIATRFWPDMLAGEGALEAPLRHAMLVDRLAALWKAKPHPGPVIVAGSTGSVPATARLMAAVLDLPEGAVVLPGLDRDADAETWAAIEADSGHAQHNLALLLRRLGRARADVRDWPAYRPDAGTGQAPGDGAERGHEARARLIREALRPARTTGAWRQLAERDAELLRDGTGGLSMLNCPTHHEEAEIIALMLREALEQPDRTAALVTPDRVLARRVKAALRRWEIEVDDSAGQPLAETPPMTFWLATAEMAVQECAPVPLLAALKHPLAACGMAAPAFRRAVRRLERAVLRGPRPAPGPAGLQAAISADMQDTGEREEAEAWLARLAPAAEVFSALLKQDAVSLIDLLSAHNSLAEILAATEEEHGDRRLWAGETGEGAAGFLGELAEAARDFPPLAGGDYLPLLEALLIGRVHRPRHGTHPRLAILGPLESRLQHHDLTILGGLNEGSWPPDPGADPWMSRQMREEFGLPAPERRIGLSAHDFQMAASAPEVVMTRAERVEGAPTVASRWWLRLETVLRALRLEDGVRRHVAGYPHWQQALDRPEQLCPASPPEPRPPLELRPRRFSVTEIETWMRDPYAIYAKRILRLRALDPLDADPGAAQRGTMIHEALDRFTRDFAGPLSSGLSPDAAGDALEHLLAIGREVFAAGIARPSVAAFWWPRFARVAEWFVAEERQRRPGIAAILSEARGSIIIREGTGRGPGGEVELTCKADRIERAREGGFTIIDFKTGTPPGTGDIDAGRAPQLPLEALILSRGGFDGLAGSGLAGGEAGEATALEYWRLSGGEPAGERKFLRDAGALMQAAEENLLALIVAFDNPATPYRSRPAPDHAPAYSDYEHLARVREWSAAGDMS